MIMFEEQERFEVMSCDNGYIVRIYIPYDKSNDQIKLFEKMTDKLIQAQNKINGDEWKNEEFISIPHAPKTNYTFVCKTKDEVSEKLTEFYKLKS